MGQLFVISAPSGAGKTSLVRALLQSRPNLVVSVSHTTRKPRETEVDGRDYHFVTPKRFHELIREGAFLEFASVFDNLYGTGRTEVEHKLAAGKHVLLEIDWQGAQQVRRAMPGCKMIFVLPPSRAALEQRLRARRTDSAATIERRLADAAADMSHYKEFDYVVVNDLFERAAQELGAILDGNGAQLRATRPELDVLTASLLHSA
ncbi:MAG TPA: guanylate kinase [Steroidobacteraceae bacterium]|nr:guanylate kinase [Steroidobacteraceae bacterium]